MLCAYNSNMNAAKPPLLKVSKLSVTFSSSGTEKGELLLTPAVEEVSFQLARGKTLAIVGESGSGKTVTALSLLNLLRHASYGPDSSVALEGEEILHLPEPAMREIRGKRIGMIFQEPMTSLNPLHTIGKQIAEAISLHQSMNKDALHRRVKELLERVQLEKLTGRLNAYPHELSGGQRQRLMIAIAIANNPDILIADEPTTALDVTVEKQILGLLEELRKDLDMSMLLITHDLNIVENVADNVVVMQGGNVVERGTVKKVFETPKQEYTQKLLKSRPSGRAVKAEEKAPSILELANLTVELPESKGWWGKQTYATIVDDVQCKLKAGHTLGIVGESGSGKTTLALAILRLLPSSGTIRFGDTYVRILEEEAMRNLRQDMQIVFQDPYSSLNPRMSVQEILSEGLEAHNIGNTMERQARIEEVLKEVGLKPEMQYRYPHEFSGGQRQRIAIARALALRPKLVIFDEPTSALDVSVQAEILKLLKKLQRDYQMAYIFISHDLRVVETISHDVMVMKDGKVVEAGSTKEVFDKPEHAYTQLLLEAVA